MSTDGACAACMTARTLDPEVTRYLAVSAARLAPRTIEAYRRDLVAFGNWFGKPMANVQREDVERYLADLRAQGLASTTIARRAAALRSFLRHQVRSVRAPTTQLPRSGFRKGRGASRARSHQVRLSGSWKRRREPLREPCATEPSSSSCTARACV